MVENRLNNSSEEQKRLVQYIQEHAIAIFDVMQPGMTIEVNIPADVSVVVPGQVATIAGKLFITRATAHLRIVPK